MSRARRPTPLRVPSVWFFDEPVPVRHPADEPLPDDCEHAIACATDETVAVRKSGVRPTIDSIDGSRDAQPEVAGPVSEGEPGCAGGLGQAPCGGGHG